MSTETTYYCENCHQKYNRNKGILLCPFCGSDFVVEQPFVMFKKAPIPEYEVMRRSYNQTFDDFSQTNFVDFPQVPRGGIPFHPNGGDFTGDLYLPQPNRRNPIQIYPRNPLTGSSREPQLGIYDPGNFGMINDVSFGQRNEVRPNYPLPHREHCPSDISPKENCVFCGLVVNEDDDTITLPCGHQSHSNCVKSSHCPVCVSLYN